MAALLGGRTALPVTEAEEEQVEPDHVYVMPPTKTMTLQAGAQAPGPRADRRLELSH